MKISELEERLRLFKEQCGDVEVVVGDADTGWLFRIDESDVCVVDHINGKHIEIDPTYGSKIDPDEINKEVKR